MELTIDIRTLATTDHVCDCCLSGGTSCCSEYDISLTEQEAEKLAGALPLAAEFRPELAEDPNVFEDDDDGSICIDKDAEGNCAFSFSSPHGMLCSLHAAALKAGIPPHQIKPVSCTLWPLSLSEPPAARLSICDDAYQACCITKLDSPQPEIAPSLMNTIDAIFGSDVRTQVQEAAQKGLDQITVQTSRV